jgi:hypothetical protein
MAYVFNYHFQKNWFLRLIRKVPSHDIKLYVLCRVSANRIIQLILAETKNSHPFKLDSNTRSSDAFRNQE